MYENTQLQKLHNTHQGLIVSAIFSLQRSAVRMRPHSVDLKYFTDLDAQVDQSAIRTSLPSINEYYLFYF